MKKIVTTNRELYKKLNMLNFSSDVVLKNVSKHQIKKVVKNLNKYGKTVSLEEVGDYFVLKKEGPFDFSVYFSNN